MDIVNLAEALVHEGIHALLFMEELQRPWGDMPRSQPNRRYRAPRLSNGLPVDAYSPNARGELPDVPGSDVDFQPGEVGDAVEKLSATVDAMRVAGPDTLKTVSRFSGAPVIRKDPGPALSLVLRCGRLRSTDTATIPDKGSQRRRN